MAAYALVLSVWLTVLPPIWLQDAALERRAIALLQQTPVSRFDPELPARSLASWLAQTVGPRAGVSWQLNDCGEPAGTADADPPLCVEVAAVLPDERKAVIVVSVGTIKRGISGVPKLNFAVVEYRGEFFTAARLRDLPQVLRQSLLPPKPKPKRRPVVLPVQNISRSLVLARPAPLPVPAALLVKMPLFGLQKGIEMEAPPPPSSVPTGRDAADSSTLGESVVRVTPAYPDAARQNRVAGEVQVQVTVAEDGRVIEAFAVTGHPLLRQAAETAAQKWVFKPAILNGKPARVKGTVTFVFKPSQ